MNKRRMLVVILIIFLSWNVLTLIFFWSKSSLKEASKDDYGTDIGKLNEEIQELREQAYKQKLLNERISKQLQYIFDQRSSITPRVKLPTIAVLVLSCNRPFVKQIIQKILKLRPADNFPVIVSQDCKHGATSDAINLFHRQITYIQQPNQTNYQFPPKIRHLQGYFKISRHYKFALNHVFNVLNYKAAIVVEDDLDISDDFFEYFSSTLPLLLNDPSLWCVSAWNDNGKKDLIDAQNGGDLLYRTDFFPGLGWMLLKELWNELEPKWPTSYWDDWMRLPEQRHGRACIRPEVPRTSTFGKIGVSKGQFFEKHLKYVKHYQKFVPFTKLDLSYLYKDKYDKDFIHKVYSLPLCDLQQLPDLHKYHNNTFRMEYRTQKEFIVIALRLAIMEDWKSDIPRMSYSMVVSVMYKGKRIYLAPPFNTPIIPILLPQSPLLALRRLSNNIR